MRCLVREINRAKQAGDEAQHGLASLLRQLGAVLGLLQDDPEEFLKSRAGQRAGPADAEVDRLIDLRLQAKKKKDYAEADRIRERLAADGIEIEDGPEGTRWRRR